ncbi:hypothetical protein C0Q70_04069 [Pomacea canaliculata]|uniref:Uncharacterized protein n=1 Tax=Pomacea canaliculata TaxID=400727 RepID=A0A2T7PUH0_POMCA|nr:hypothetical protein C0Q70_04069 [Pomacea canaliculata]
MSRVGDLSILSSFITNLLKDTEDKDKRGSGIFGGGYMAISLQICQAEAGARKVAEEGQSDKTMRPAWQIHSTQSGTRSPRVRVPPRPPPHSSWEYKTSALAARTFWSLRAFYVSCLSV